MNIVCDKTLLSAAIDGVSKAVTMRSSIPVLEGILLKAEGFQLTLTGYDLEMGIVTTIEANIKEPGEIVLNAKLLSSMISRMPAGQISIVAADNGKTTIQSGVAQFEIQSMPATDFPDLPNTGAEQTLTIKTGVLSGETLFSLFEDGTLTDAPAEVIARCIRYKAGVVERDEKERGERRKLNLGHTVGHAIEKCSGYAIPHGHAVAAGLAVMARASERLGWAEPGVSARIAACLEKNGLPTGTDYPAEALAKAALADKKRSGDSITIVVPRAIGDCELKRIPVTELLPIIAAGLGG